MKKLCCLLIGFSILFFSYFAEANNCRIQEHPFLQKGVKNEFGGPVYEILYSCDGWNWFREKPVYVNTYIKPNPTPRSTNKPNQYYQTVPKGRYQKHNRYYPNQQQY